MKPSTAGSEFELPTGAPSSFEATAVESTNFTLKLLLKAQKLKATRMTIQAAEDSVVVSFFGEQEDPIERAKAGGIAFSDLQEHLDQTTYAWPEPNDPSFTVNLKSARRLFIAPLSGTRAIADVLLTRLKENNQKALLFDNLKFEDVPAIVDSMEFSPNNRAAFLQGCKSKTGLILVSSAVGDNPIGAAAVMLAARPDALLFRNVSSVEGAQQAIEQSKSRLVVVEQNGSDPFQMLTGFTKLFGGQATLLADFCSSLKMVFVHHWTSRVCNSCCRETTGDPHTLEKIPVSLRPDRDRPYRFGRGCPDCGHSAYRGYVGLDSVLLVDEQIRGMILKEAPEASMVEVGYRKGTRCLLEDGLEKIFAGLTSYESVLKHAGTPSTGWEAAIANHSETEDETPKDVEIRSSLEALDEDFFSSKTEKTSTASLMVVEDDEDQREVLELVFQTEGYDVYSAENGVDALAKLKERPVDLVVCDLMMPKMNGEEFLKEVRKNPELSNMLVMMLTAVESADAEFQLLESGADDYCNKNVKRKILLKRVERLLERKRGRNPLEHMLS